MTMLELAQRDLRRTVNSLTAARKRPNVPMSELAHIEELVELREGILNLVKENELECPLGGDETDDCADCPYSCDYHFVNGDCVRRTCNE